MTNNKKETKEVKELKIKEQIKTLEAQIKAADSEQKIYLAMKLKDKQSQLATFNENKK